MNHFQILYISLELREKIQKCTFKCKKIQKCHMNSSCYCFSYLWISKNKVHFSSLITEALLKPVYLEVSNVCDSLCSSIMSAVSHPEFLHFVFHFKMLFYTSSKLWFLFLTPPVARVFWKPDFIFSGWITQLSLPHWSPCICGCSEEHFLPKMKDGRKC